MKKFALALVLLAAGSAPVFAQIGLNSIGQVYTENFDSLTTTTLSATAGAQIALNGLVEWKAAKLSGTGASAMPFNIDNGASNTGGIFSYGATSATDRALGSLASGSNTPAFGASFINNTGSMLTDVSVSFTAEFWRSSTTTQNVLTFGYGLLGGAVTSSNFLSAAASSFSALNVVGPAAVGTNGALDGNLSGNQAAVAATIGGLSWLPGETLFLRWQDTNEVGNDAGLAIDNFSVTAIPEPSTYALILSLTGFGFVAWRRHARTVLAGGV